MKRIRLPERVLDEVEARIRDSPESVTGGLLIGYPIDGAYWVERVLACRNVAAAALRASGYLIESGALANVSATLARTPLAVLGFFYGGGTLRPGERARLEGGSLDPGSIRLVPTSNGHRTPPNAWCELEDLGEFELVVEVVATQEGTVPFCPE